MKLPHNTFYYEAKEKSVEKLQENVDLPDEIERICLAFPRYGYRRVTRQLHRNGGAGKHKRVLRIIRENELICQMKRVRVRTIKINHSHPIFPHLVENVITTATNQVWIADITTSHCQRIRLPLSHSGL